VLLCSINSKYVHPTSNTFGTHYRCLLGRATTAFLQVLVVVVVVLIVNFRASRKCDSMSLLSMARSWYDVVLLDLLIMADL